MTIETKYNIGDKVWFQTLGTNHNANIIHINNKGYSYERHEDELFPTKEELLNSL